MKNKLLLLLGILLATSNLTIFSQNKGRQYGLINSSGEVVIPFMFDNMRVEREILNGPNYYIWVSQNGFEGLMDTNGKTLVPCEYDLIEYVSDNMATVKLDGKYGSVDLTTGKLVIPCIYYYVGYFFDGIAHLHKSGKSWLIDKTGKLITLGIYDHIGDFHYGFCGVEKESKWGFINKEGKEVVPCIYDWVGIFNDKGIVDISNNHLIGFINTKGEEVVPCIYDKVKRIYDNTNNIYKNSAIAVMKDGKWGFLNAKGEEIIKPQYDNVSESRSDYLFFNVKSNGKYGYIDAMGNEILPCEFDREGRYLGGHCLEVCKDSKKGIYNLISKKMISPFVYEECWGDIDGYFEVKKNGSTYYIDSIGNEHVNIYRKGYERIKKYKLEGKEKYGLLDSNGHQIVDYIYDNVEYAANDIYIVYKAGEYGLINGKGQIIVPTIYDRIIYEKEVGCFKVRKLIQ